MQQLDSALDKLKFKQLNDYKPIARFFTHPQASLAVVTFGAFVFIFLCTLFNFAPRILIGVTGTLIPAIQAINTYTQQGELYLSLPYFLIFSTYMIFQGWILYLLSFIPFMNTICFFFVIALYHPDIELANWIWDQVLQRIV